MSDNSLSNIARKQLAASRGDFDDALVKLCESRESKLQTKELVRQAWQTILGRVLSARRSEVMVAAGDSSAASLVSTSGRATWERRANQRNALLKIMEWWYVGKKPLGIATDEDLRTDINRRKSDIDTTTKAVNFETGVLRGMTTGKKVSDCYTSDRLAQIALKCGVAADDRERCNGDQKPRERSRQKNHVVRPNRRSAKSAESRPAA